MSTAFLASTDPITVSTALQYAVMIVAGLLTLILSLLAAIWSQNKRQNDTVLAQLQRQADAIDRKLEGCRAKDDASHKAFHVSIDALRETFSRAKERIARLEERTDC